MPGEEKKYDVTFIGNLNGNVQTRRMPLLNIAGAIHQPHSSISTARLKNWLRN